MICKCGKTFEPFKRNGINVSTKCLDCQRIKVKKPKKKKVLTENQQVEKLRKKCVTIAKKLARQRDNFKCEYCGIGEPQKRTHGSHIYSEGTNRAMSADVDNILCLCASHHMVGQWNQSAKDFNWHGSPAEAMDWFTKKYPELYQKLKSRTQQYHKLDRIFWEKKMEELRNISTGILS